MVDGGGGLLCHATVVDAVTYRLEINETDGDVPPLPLFLRISQVKIRSRRISAGAAKHSRGGSVNYVLMKALGS